MAEKSIGQVLQIARQEQELSISDAQRLTKIKKRYLKALENDSFDDIPAESQARNLLARYADFLELDKDVVLDAYDTDSLLSVYEVNATEVRTGRVRRRRSQRKKTSFLPIFYLFLISASILSFVAYTVWKYVEADDQSVTAPSSYQMGQSRSSSSSSISDLNSSTSAPSSSMATDPVSITSTAISPESLMADISNGPEEVKVTVSVTDAESWISISDTELAQGILLSVENPSASVTVNKQVVSSLIINLGAVEGVTVQVEDQSLDLSSLTSPTAALTLNFK